MIKHVTGSILDRAFGGMERFDHRYLISTESSEMSSMDVQSSSRVSIKNMQDGKGTRSTED